MALGALVAHRVAGRARLEAPPGGITRRTHGHGQSIDELTPEEANDRAVALQMTRLALRIQYGCMPVAALLRADHAAADRRF